jgi:hypothetical protein
MANRNFTDQQALETKITTLFCKFLTDEPGTPSDATLDLSTDIVLTDTVNRASRNGATFELVVEAAAANEDDEVLVSFTGTLDAIVCTVTPNDGTNNSATPVDLDEDELAELINTGAVVGKNIVLTDVDGLRTAQTATGGASSALASSDDQVVSFASGVTAVAPAFVPGFGVGFDRVEKATNGEYILHLSDKYVDVQSVKVMLQGTSGQDRVAQLFLQDVGTEKRVWLLLNSGSSPSEPTAGTPVLVKLELKNSSVRT